MANKSIMDEICVMDIGSVNSTVNIIEAKKDAVIVELIKGDFIVYIECKDMDKKIFLIDMAKEILRLI